MKSQLQTGFLMAKIRQVSGRISEQILKEYNIELNSAQGRIMFVLWHKDGISINELAKKTQLKKSSLTSMLDRLEKMGYIKRKRCEKDRRKILIKRTNKDRDLESKYVELSQKISDLYFNGFSESEIVCFEINLARILDNLVQHEELHSRKNCLDRKTESSIRNS